GFQPPELAAMVATATRPAPGRARWAWPILAAVLLLAIPLLTVLLRQSQHPAVHQPVGPAPGLKLLGSVPWVQAVSQPDGHSVSVYVDINNAPGGGCLSYFPVLQANTVETSSQITIRVQAYQPADYQTPSAAPGTVQACAAVNYYPVPLLVNLGGPVAERRLVDASTGNAYPARQAADLPSLSKLPAGYLDTGSSPAQAPDQRPGFADRTYRLGRQVLKLLRGPVGRSSFYAINPVEATGTVLGHPAKVGGPGNGQYRCVGWTDPSYSWQLCSIETYADVPVPLPAAELLSIANSIH
ncbi:MAG TPA: hypothetical protein VH298_00640, partial [Jatrophihabitans sp.]|nr:hypothetical protein [Jatrophihabitans sp.]